MASTLVSMKVIRPGSKRPAIFNTGRRRKPGRRQDLSVEVRELALRQTPDQVSSTSISSQVTVR